MKNFLPSALQARHTLISGTAGNISIEVMLKPFLMNQEIIDTSIRLDGVRIPSSILRDLVSKTFNFPTNPTEGYIDGSIYLDNTHHPIDVTKIEFHQTRDGGAIIVIKGVYVFEYEGLGGCQSTSFTLSSTISSCTV